MLLSSLCVRVVVVLLSMLAVLATPTRVAAQSGRLYKIGIVLQGGAYYLAIDGLRDGLRELGLEEGKHVVFIVRDGKGDLKAVEAAAKVLEQDKVDLIYAITTSVAIATKRATNSVPIVFYAGTDPVALGLVESVRKPGGRLTGTYGWVTDLTAKRLELLKEMLPRLRRVVTFYNPDNPSSQQSIKIARSTAPRLKLELIEHRVASVEALRSALHALRPGDADAFCYVSDAMVTSQADAIVDVAMGKKLPTMFQARDAVVRGGLASYGVSYYEFGRLSARHVQRILQGAEPGAIPVEQLEKFRFVVNLKTARALGLVIPQAVLTRADEVIE